MKTNNTSTQIQNISDNERGFRVALALVMVATAISGAIVTPAAMFALAATSIYLVTTAIVAADPIYAASRYLAKVTTSSINNSVTA